MAATRKKPIINPERQKLQHLLDTLEELMALRPGMTKPAAKRTIHELQTFARRVLDAVAELDPIRDPGSMFDPTVPETAGHLVALALLAQEKVPLENIGRTYGSGIYAIYFMGNHQAYNKISGTETPIYVGKADPRTSQAKTARDQGTALFSRLSDHRKSIRKVQKYAEENGLSDMLHIEDFFCRKLVCATNMQLVAETHLINIFNPIWNKDVGICWGISKHGDSAKTRSNDRSPWDVIHPGREWAMDPSLVDKFPATQILQRIDAHFIAQPPFTSRDEIIEQIISEFAQEPGLVPEHVAEVEDKNEPTEE